MKIFRNVIFQPESPKQVSDSKYTFCTLKENNYTKATFDQSSFDNCNLSDCCFSNAHISDCVFVHCDFTYCNLFKIKIRNSQFVQCNFHHSNLCHSVIAKSSFSQCNIQALFKELNWKQNVFDKDTIIESCGGTHYVMPLDMIAEIQKQNKIYGTLNFEVEVS